MEFQQLKYFRAVAEQEHVTKAAKKLFVSQSALSRAVTQLEEELGVALFHRQGRAVILSRHGKTFLDFVTRAQGILEAGRRQLREESGKETGTVALGFETFPQRPPRVCRDKEDSRRFHLSRPRPVS